ncbi:hypothetical protein F2Q70_00003550 [Brassica cretica]|uniref:Uncharacterized protein n=1 Tax=Brassica cretica TaxID=69181 RepID=A0A8S9J3T3_BRACR|nr:hypothetical protein F2Q70_00003550 [Brassica cretica]
MRVRRGFAGDGSSRMVGIAVKGREIAERIEREAEAEITKKEEEGISMFCSEMWLDIVNWNTMKICRRLSTLFSTLLSSFGFGFSSTLPILPPHASCLHMLLWHIDLENPKLWHFAYKLLASRSLLGVPCHRYFIWRDSSSCANPSLASPTRDLEAGVLPGVWRNSIPEYFSPTVCPLFLDFVIELGVTCALKSTGVAYFQQASPGRDIALVILLSRVPLRPKPYFEPGEDRFPCSRPRPSGVLEMTEPGALMILEEEA